MASALIGDVINVDNTTTINVLNDLTVSNDVTITSIANAQPSTLYLPSAANIYIGTPAVNISTSIYTSGVPIGSIAMWNNLVSTSIPTSWAICDGENGTPNLIGRFVICAGTKYLRGTSGGNITTTLTSNSLPSHTHGNFNTNKFRHNHNITGIADTNNAANVRSCLVGSGSRSTINLNKTNTNHSHAAHNMDSYGNASPFNILPPYYSLIYIMKIS